jgi:hypothetical protein
MKINRSLLSVFFVLSFTFLQTAHADDNRSDKPFGLYLSAGSFTRFVINAAYNLDHVFRLTGGLGYSQIVGLTVQYPDHNATEIGFGSMDDVVVDINMKAMLPHLEFSPLVGLGLTNYTTLNTYGLYLQDMLFPYVDVGLDYQAKDGFDFGLDIQVLISDIANAAALNDSYVIGRFNVGKFF